MTDTYIPSREHGFLGRVICWSASLALLGVTALWTSTSSAQDAPPESIYLRYQGMIEGIGDQPLEQIDCSFSLHSIARAGEEVWSELHEGIFLTAGHFTVALGSQGESPLITSLFAERLRLRVRCNLDLDSAYEVDVEEPVGLNPYAVTSRSAQRADTADSATTSETSGFAENASFADSAESATNAESAERADFAERAGAADSADEVRGSVYADFVDVGDARVISDTGEWVGLPPVASAVRVNGVDLVSAEGAWTGPVTGFVTPQDQDQDGFNDLVESILGTNPQDPDSKPADLNADQKADVLEDARGDADFSPADQSFTSRFEASASVADLFIDPQTLDEWVAATLTFEESGALIDLQLELELNHTVDTRALDITLLTPEGERISLRLADSDPEALLLTETLSIDVGALLSADVERELSGAWSILLRDEFGPDNADVTAAVTTFELNATYRSSTMISASRDVTLSGEQRLIGVSAPTQDDEAANKAYVDAQVSGEVTSLDVSLRALINAQTQRVFDDVGVALSALDPSVTSRFTYRSRTFKTYDELSGSYVFGDLPTLFGGVAPSSWSTGATANQADLNTLDALLNREGTGGTNALVSVDVYQQRSDEQGIFLIVHAQVENTTDLAIEWPIEFSYSCYDERATAPQRSSLAFNGSLEWSSANQLCGSGSQSAAVTLTVPTQQVSDLLFVIAAGAPVTAHTDASGVVTQERNMTFALTNECLTLPEGLRYRKLW